MKAFISVVLQLLFNRMIAMKEVELRPDPVSVRAAKNQPKLFEGPIMRMRVIQR